MYIVYIYLLLLHLFAYVRTEMWCATHTTHSHLGVMVVYLFSLHINQSLLLLCTLSYILIRAAHFTHAFSSRWKWIVVEVVLVTIIWNDSYVGSYEISDDACVRACVCLFVLLDELSWFQTVSLCQMRFFCSVMCVCVHTCLCNLYFQCISICVYICKSNNHKGKYTVHVRVSNGYTEQKSA